MQRIQRLALTFPLLLLLVIFALVLSSGGCAQLAPARQNVVAGVTAYCKTFTLPQRQLFRADVAAGLAKVCVQPVDSDTVQCGAAIAVHCPGDPPDAPGANAGN